MSDLGWRADGIKRARACGGVELEKYRKPGFTGGIGVRRVTVSEETAEDHYVDPHPPREEE